MTTPNDPLDCIDMALADAEARVVRQEKELKQLRPLAALLRSPSETHFMLYCGTCMDDWEIGEEIDIFDGKPESFIATAGIDGICPGCGEDTLQLVIHFCGEDRGKTVMKYLEETK